MDGAEVGTRPLYPRVADRGKCVVMIALRGRGQPPRLQFDHGMESCGRRPFLKGEDAGLGELSGPGRAGVWE